jgi:hypothetical protein
VSPIPEPWGGYENGKIPAEAMRPIAHATDSTGRVVRHHRLRADAAMALDRLLLMAPATLRYITDSYRDYATQVRLKEEKGKWAATPGTSNHGWAMAADCAYSDPRGFARWLWDHTATAREHGWYSPKWTHDGVGIEEPWHWEYDQRLDIHHNELPGSPVTEDSMKPGDIMKFAQAQGQPVYLLNILDGTREGIETHEARLGVAKLFGLDATVHQVHADVTAQFVDVKR